MVLVTINNQVVARCKTPKSAIKYIKHRYEKFGPVSIIFEDKGERHIQTINPKDGLIVFTLYSVHAWPKKRKVQDV